MEEDETPVPTGYMRYLPSKPVYPNAEASKRAIRRNTVRLNIALTTVNTIIVLLWVHILDTRVASGLVEYFMYVVGGLMVAQMMVSAAFFLVSHSRRAFKWLRQRSPCRVCWRAPTEPGSVDAIRKLRLGQALRPAANVNKAKCVRVSRLRATPITDSVSSQFTTLHGMPLDAWGSEGPDQPEKLPELADLQSSAAYSQLKQAARVMYTPEGTTVEPLRRRPRYLPSPLPRSVAPSLCVGSKGPSSAALESHQSMLQQASSFMASAWASLWAMQAQQVRAKLPHYHSSGDYDVQQDETEPNCGRHSKELLSYQSDDSAQWQFEMPLTVMPLGARSQVITASTSVPSTRDRVSEQFPVLKWGVESSVGGNPLSGDGLHAEAQSLVSPHACEMPEYGRMGRDAGDLTDPEQDNRTMVDCGQPASSVLGGSVQWSDLDMRARQTPELAFLQALSRPGMPPVIARESRNSLSVWTGLQDANARIYDAESTDGDDSVDATSNRSNRSDSGNSEPAEPVMV